jgi:hypothetical protein
MSATQSTSGRPAPCTWWSDRWAWRGALGAAPLGALVAILYALVVLRTSPTDALMAYALGAAMAGGVGCLLLGPLGASIETVRHRRRQRAAAADPADDLALVEPADAGDWPAEHDDARPAQPAAA